MLKSVIGICLVGQCVSKGHRIWSWHTSEGLVLPGSKCCRMSESGCAWLETVSSAVLKNMDQKIRPCNSAPWGGSIAGC